MDLRSALLFRAAAPALGLALTACVERSVDEASSAPIYAESFEIPFALPEANLGSVARLRLHRLHELVQQGLHEEAKAELAQLAAEEDARELVETLERWDRYLDGCIALRSLHGAVVAERGTAFTAGARVRLELELMSVDSEPIEIPARGVDEGSYRGESEASFFKLRITEIWFDGLGAHASAVRWETLPLDESLQCGGAAAARTSYELPQEPTAAWAMKLVRIDATLYPCAARVAGRYVPLRPVAFDPEVITLYPTGWESLRGDPLLALRAACASEDASYDRHVLISASLLERGGPAEHEAYGVLQTLATQGPPRVRLKARAALDWLRHDATALWGEATRLAPARAQPNERGSTLDLPRR